MDGFGTARPVVRTEDARLLRGGGRYIDDVDLPGQCHGYLLRSPHAHARILSVDTAAARAAPGVLDVITGADYEAAGFGALPLVLLPVPNFGADKMHPARHMPLATERVRHVGDGVAFVVAETREQARDAAEVIAVDYEILPSVVETATANAPDAAPVWDDCPNNVAFEFEQGDKAAVEQGFAGAAHVVRHRIRINRLAPSTMETRGVAADYDPKADFQTVYLGNQNAFGARAQIAALLNLPEDRMRVVAGDVGGSFGMKGCMYGETPLTVWASRRLGRPVKWVSDRSEAFLSDCHARDKVVDAELALDNDYKFLALRVHAQSNVGAYYATLGTFPIILSTSGLAGSYTTPAIHFKATAVFTNCNPMTPYRGSGRPDAGYILERMIDVAARQLELDPADIRARNLIPAAAMPFQTPLGAKYDSGDFPKNQEMALARADHAGFAARRAEAAGRGKLRGFGIGNNVEGAAPPGQEMARIEIDHEGTAIVSVGSTDQGQGHATLYTQIAAEQLGLPPDKVRVTEGDTDILEQGFGTGGSKVSSLGGSAVFEATRLVVEKGKRIAAHVLEASEADIAFEDGTFKVAGTDRSITLAALAEAAADPARLPEGETPGLSETGTHQTKAPTFPSGCHVCEVEIDPETGRVSVERYVAVTDVGRSVNPRQVDGQIQGGIVQAVGQALSESVVYDRDTGQLLSGSFMDYAMPHADDISAIECVDNPVPTEVNPLGVKGAGEIGAGCAVGAVVNAVVDALAPLGIVHVDMPITPETVWRAVQGAK